MYLQVLSTLLSQDVAITVIGPAGIGLSTAITDYLFNHRLYQLLEMAIQRIVCQRLSRDH